MAEGVAHDHRVVEIVRAHALRPRWRFGFCESHGSQPRPWSSYSKQAVLPFNARPNV